MAQFAASAGPEHSDEYRRTIASARWKRLRKERIQAANWCCQRCNRPQGTLELHHKTYERLGHERPEDVEALCATCHVVADGERTQATRHRIWDARVDGWARKVYGEEYWFDHDAEVIEEEFAKWIDGRGENEE